jgi:hypothetical protein
LSEWCSSFVRTRRNSRSRQRRALPGPCPSSMGQGHPSELIAPPPE